jgi:hypothetical protein
MHHILKIFAIQKDLKPDITRLKAVEGGWFGWRRWGLVQEEEKTEG